MRRLDPSPTTRRARHSLGAAALAAVAAVACAENGDSAESGEGDGGQAETVERMAEHMEAQDRESVADILLDEEDTTITELPAPYLDQWALYQVDHVGASNDVQYFIAAGQQDSLFLRAQPDTFAELLSADEVEIADADTAVEVARDYLLTTRPTDQHSYVVDSLDDIDFIPDAAEEELARLDEEGLADVVSAPGAEENEEGDYQVTAYVIYGPDLIERTLTFHGDATITDEAEPLAEDLAVPLSL
jgi:hypothetical protein